MGIVPVVKEREMEIGYPTDVKHVAHVGWDGPLGSGPSWVMKIMLQKSLSWTKCFIIFCILLLTFVFFVLFIQMDDFNTAPDFSTSLGNLNELRDDSNPMAATALWSSQGML